MGNKWKKRNRNTCSGILFSLLVSQRLTKPLCLTEGKFSPLRLWTVVDISLNVGEKHLSCNLWTLGMGMGTYNNSIPEERTFLFSYFHLNSIILFKKKNRKTEYFCPYKQYNTVLKKVKDKLKSKNNICPIQWYPNFLCFLLRKCTTLLFVTIDVVSWHC